jgi:AcrR family transcriptional regulator
MNKTEIRKKNVLEMVADHLLAQGLKGASLRKMAEAAGTSDRMLLHYFADKEELMTGALALVAGRLVGILESARSEQLPFQIFLPHLAEMMKDPQVRPYLKLSLELVALAADERGSYRGIALKIWNDFLDWIAAALKEDRMPMAALAFATTEGFMLLDALGCGSVITDALEGLKIRGSSGKGKKK